MLPTQASSLTHPSLPMSGSLSMHRSVSQWAGQDALTHFKSLEAIKSLGTGQQNQALKEISKQFEAMFLNMMLKSMRSANAVFEQGNELNSFAFKLHRDLLDYQYTLNASKGNGTGLAAAFYRQFEQQYSRELQRSPRRRGDVEPAVAEIRSAVVEQSPAAEEHNSSPVLRQMSGGRQAMTASPEQFIEQVAAHAKKAAKKLGVAPQVLVAQAALETGWGRHVIHDREGNNGFNLFNIKADSRWQGDSIALNVLEYKEGVAVQEKAAFRRYADIKESFSDYVRFLTSGERYRTALASSGDTETFLQQLQAGGYATDPQYANKIMAIVNSQPLKNFSVKW